MAVSRKTEKWTRETTKKQQTALKCTCGTGEVQVVMDLEGGDADRAVAVKAFPGGFREVKPKDRDRLLD